MTGRKKTHNVAIGVGSNLGSPRENIRAAAKQLAEAGLEGISCSPFYTTAPVDCVPGTPDFTNCAFTGHWEGGPHELLKVCQRIETELGRPAIHSSNEARTIDLDILLFEDLQVDSENLTIPHPRMTERYFVLAPLNDLAPEWTVPGHGMVKDLFSGLK